MNVEERLADARRRLIEVEMSVPQLLAAARASLTALEEEARSLRLQAARKSVEIFTESEFAERLKVSAQTLARLRKKGRLQPLMIGESVRYSSEHLEKLHEIFGAKVTEAQRRREHMRRAS